MKFIVLLVIFANPTNVQNAAMTLAPEQTIEFSNTTEKNTLADCVRVQKALTTSKKIAYCGDVRPIEAPTVTPAAAE